MGDKVTPGKKENDQELFGKPPITPAQSNLEEDEYAKFISTLVFLIIFICFGIPIWWHTTNVYRVSLPYSKIEKFSSLNIDHYVTINIIIADSKINASLLWEKLSTKTITSNGDFWKIHYSWKTRYATELEKTNLNSNRLVKEDNIPGAINIYLIHFNLHSLHSYSFNNYQRSVLVDSQKDFEDLIKFIHDLVSNIIIKESILKETYTPPTIRKPQNKHRLSISATPSIDITYSLIVSDPHNIRATWDIEQAIDTYVNPYLEKISNYINFDIKSQIIYMSLPTVHSLYNDSAKCHIWMANQLPHVINPIEGKLGSHISTNPTLNFVIYVPPLSQTPLRIYDESGFPSESNAFITPQWGGIAIANAYNSTFKVDLRESMGIFLSQLRILLGIPSLRTHNIENSNLLSWEMDYLLRRYTQEQIAQASSSLISLGKLLETIENIVIKDEIGNKIFVAVEAIEASLDLLKQGFLEDAFRQSQTALINSEKAFFDPSLLALLYFPDDEKYAVYVPLFIPITIPIALSVKSLFLFLRKPKKY